MLYPVDHSTAASLLTLVSINSTIAKSSGTERTPGKQSASSAIQAK